MKGTSSLASASVGLALILARATLGCSGSSHPGYIQESPFDAAEDDGVAVVRDTAVIDPGDAATDSGDAVVADFGVPGNPCHGAPGNYMQIEGSPGDPILPGLYTAGASEPATFSLPSDVPDLVIVKAIRQNDGVSILFLFSTELTGDVLKVGSYPNAIYYKYKSAGAPAFNLVANGRNCEEATGSFEIQAISFEAGHLRGIEATITRDCSGGSIVGCVKYGTVP